MEREREGGTSRGRGPGRGVARRRTAWAMFGVLGLVAPGVANQRWIAHPEVTRPRPADAIVVLAGPGERRDAGLELLRGGWSDTIVLASAHDETTGWWSARSCNSPREDLEPEATVICFSPSPATTRGEVRAVADLAREEGWDELLVVAGQDQVTRARMLLGRCWDGTAWFVDPVPHPRGSLHAAYEWAALAKALTVARSC